MGRAARRKAQAGQQRRPRTVAVFNAAAGRVETHRVTISDQGVADWVRDRDHLKAQGYPDRPPDYDDPKQRSWTPRPNEMATEDLEADDRGEFVCSWVTGLPAHRVIYKMLAFERPDGAFVLTGRIFEPTHTESKDFIYGTWLDLVEAVTMTKTYWASLGCIEPTVLTRGEMEAAMGAQEAA